jgi:DNA ligase (NAD+)
MELANENSEAGRLYSKMAEYMYGYYMSIIDAYTHGKEIDTERLQTELLKLDRLYGMGYYTPLSDEEYDRLHQIYIELTGEMISGDMSAEKRAEHEYPSLKGTISKVHYITEKEKDEDPNAIVAHKSLCTWIRRALFDVRSTTGYQGDAILGFWPKYDGMSVVFSLNEQGMVTKAITRGDMQEGTGQDKTELFKKINMANAVPKQFRGKKCGLKVEVIVSKEGFAEYNKKYRQNELADARAAAAALLSSEEWTDIHSKYLSIVPLMIYGEGDFYIYNLVDEDDGIQLGPIDYINVIHTDSTLDRVIEETIADCKLKIDALEYNCDGIVVRWITPIIRKTLGRNESRSINNFEVAYKFPKPNNYTKIIDIEQEIGILGNVSYTAVFEPFKFNGRTVSRASLGSYGRFKSLNLAKGDMVNVKYEIIPYLCVDEYCLQHRSGNPPIKEITKCPYCGKHLVMDNNTPRCGNLQCDFRVMGTIVNFCKSMRIKGIGPSTIESLFHHGIVTSIEDLFTLKDKKEFVTKIDGYGDTSFDKMVKAISKATGTEADILGSIGIKNIGIKKSEKILNIYHIQDLLEMSDSTTKIKAIEKLEKLPGVGTSNATSLIDGVGRNRHLLEYLLQVIEIKDMQKEDAKGYAVFTGFRDPKLEAKMNKHGIYLENNITSKTTLLVAAKMDSNSNKIKKAKEKNIPIISLEEAYSMYE